MIPAVYSSVFANQQLNQVKAAIKESVVEGTLDTIEDLLLLAGFKPGYFLLNGADFINKGLMLTQYTNIILQELVNTDHLLVDAVYFPNATNPTLIKSLKPGVLYFKVPPVQGCPQFVGS